MILVLKFTALHNVLMKSCSDDSGVLTNISAAGTDVSGFIHSSKIKFYGDSSVRTDAFGECPGEI